MSRKAPELNTGSMADISFLLLTFFLLVSNIDTDMGLSRKLPPIPDPGATPDVVNERNVFVVLVNARNQLLVEGVPTEIGQLKEKTKEFFLNPSNSPKLSDKEMKPIELIGNYNKSKGVVSLRNDRSTKYGTYIQVQNEIAAAINEMRNDLSREKFNKNFDDLTEPQRKAISKAIPVAVSEAEPKDIGGTK